MNTLRFAFTANLVCKFVVLATAAAAAFCALPSARADDAPSRIHALVNVEFADKYLTPRGMIVQDHGLTTQVLLLAFVNVYNGDPGDFVNSVTVIPGVWNDYATSPVAEHLTAGSRKTDWIEYDPILGVEFGVAKNFKLDVTYTEFGMQILDIGTSQHLETKLAYDDSAALGAYALHPYVSYWKELQGKATAAANFHVPASYYFEVGIDPGWSVGGLKFDVPIRALLPSKEFYGEKFAAKSDVALYEVGVKAAGSVKFLPAGYGHWNWHLGYKYVTFVDDNLKQLSTGGGFATRTRGTGQIYSGFSSFF